MNLDPTVFGLLHIDNVISSLNKRSVESAFQEIQELISWRGLQTERHVFRSLVAATDFSIDSKGQSKDTKQLLLLKLVVAKYFKLHHFGESLAFAFDNPPRNSKNLKLNEHLFSQICKSLRLTKSQELLFGVFLSRCRRKELSAVATDFLRKKFSEVFSSDVGDLKSLPVEYLHLILSTAYSHLEELGLNTAVIQNFLPKLKKEIPEGSCPIALLPFLYPEHSQEASLKELHLTTNMDVPVVKPITGSLALQVQDIGYVFCSKVENCRKHLTMLGVSEINPCSVAHILAMMVRTHTGLKDGVPLAQSQSPWPEEKDEPTSWCVENFVSVVRELVPGLNWPEVVNELDHPGFTVKDKTGLQLLTTALTKGLWHTVFPIYLLYKPWNNKDGQIKWLKQIILNADVFFLKDLPHKAVNCDMLKVQPEDADKPVNQWKCLNLTEILLQLADTPGLYSQAQDCFVQPKKSAPDILFVALIQAQLPMSQLRHELLLSVVPVFLGNHPNSTAVLQYAWNQQSPNNFYKQVILNGMADWYLRGPDDPVRLGRILDVAHDLKALSNLLNINQLTFAIDLACLASRREYLKLDKWIVDKIAEHGETFLSASIAFLKRRFPNVFGGDPKPATLPPEILSTILHSLQQVVSNVTPASAQEIMQILSNCRSFLSKPLPSSSAQTPQTPVATPSLSLGSLPPPPTPPVPSASTPVGGGGAIMPPTSLGSRIGPPGSQSAMGTPMTSSRTPIGPGPSDIASYGSMMMDRGGPGPAGMSRMESLFSGGAPGVGMGPPGPGSLGSFGGLGAISSQQPTSSGSPAASMMHSGFGSMNMGFDSGLFGGRHPAQSVTPIGGLRGSMQAKIGGAGSMPLAMPVSGISSVSSQQLSEPDINQAFSDEVQEESNGYFQQIYTQPPQPCMSIEQFLDILKRFKVAQDKKERDVFACMIKNLFEEYRFFPQYPEKELYTTALLFGGIIREGIVSGMPLAFALKVVLEALRKDVRTKMWFFGLYALEKFKTKLKEHPSYCQHITQIPGYPHSQNFSKTLIAYIEAGMKSEDPPPESVQHRGETPLPPGVLSQSVAPLTQVASQPILSISENVVATSTIATSTLRATASAFPISGGGASTEKRSSGPSVISTNIDTLVSASEREDQKVVVPSDNITERVSFLFNNLSRANLNQKMEEMREVIELKKEETISDETPPYLPWLCQYLVMKRVSIEPNFHVLYSMFLDALNSKKFNELVQGETYRNIKVLLRSDKDVSNFSDRSLLKNLGHWLGMISLGRNKPVLQKDLDVKSLLLEAYWKGQQELLYVVPFVAKVLESCKNSRIFRPPCPWTLGLLSVLAELHREPDLKLNLKFEIEVLCNHLEIELGSLMPAPHKCVLPTTQFQNLEPQLGNMKKLAKPELPLGPSPIPQRATATTPTAGHMTTTTHHTEEGLGLHSATVQSSQSTTPAPLPVFVPKFSFNDLNISSMQGLYPHITINANLPLFQLNPPLKSCIPKAIEHAVHELSLPVADRAIKVAVSTADHIVRKDYALDPDENHLRLAARQMVRSLTAGMAMISCREPLMGQIQTNLRQSLSSQLRGATPEQLQMIETAVNAVAEDNVELAQCFVVKLAVERAVPQMEMRLRDAIEQRQRTRMTGQAYFDQTAAAINDRLPEQIRLLRGSVSAQQSQVYEEYAKQIPGFKPIIATATEEKPTLALAPEGLENEPLSRVLRELDALLVHAPPGIPQTEALITLRNEVGHLLSSQGRDNSLVVQNIADCLLEKYRNTGENVEWTMKMRTAYSAVLQLLQLSQLFQKQVTKALMENKTNARYNVEAVDFLIRQGLINMTAYDIHLAQSMEQGLNYSAVHFAMQLLRLYLIDDRHAGVTENDLSNTIEALSRLNTPNKQLQMGENYVATVMEMLRSQTIQAPAVQNAPIPQIPGMPGDLSSAGPAQTPVGIAPLPGGLRGAAPTPSHFDRPAPAMRGLEPGFPGGAAMPSATPVSTPIGQGALDYPGEDPPGLQEKAESILREWVTMYHNANFPRAAPQAYLTIVNLMNQSGLLKSDEMITRFLRLCTEMCVDLCYKAFGTTPQNISQMVRQRCFHTLDAYVKLISMLIRNSGDTSLQVRLNLVNKILSIVMRVIVTDQMEVRRLEFHQMPYQRLLMMLFLDLTAPGEQLSDAMNFQILSSFWNTLSHLQPRKVPGFVYAWLDVIGHRTYLERMLAKSPTPAKTWSMYAMLIIEHLKFLAPFLRNIEMSKPIALIYKGTLRILLVLLHDFPELLCEYHSQICDVIPPNCVQLRNLILSAYPRNMRLPDPFMPNLKVEQLAEIMQHPRLSMNFDQYIPADLRANLDNYLKNRSPVNFLSDLRRKLEPNPDKPGQKYNISLMNAVVLYVGFQAIQSITDTGKRASMQSITHSAHMDIFQNLAVDLDTEGRYLFFNAIGNQLRYPNSHTYYFSCVILYLFAEANSEAIQEQITRILFERLMALRPHPWGLLITFIELIKNPNYRFWNHQFVRCAPEIEKLFESVARSCMTKQSLTQPQQEPQI